jgi:hypothetical protein
MHDRGARDDFYLRGFLATALDNYLPRSQTQLRVYYGHLLLRKGLKWLVIAHI